jgi:4-hydroxy-tetrahydrodipicolinate synthase
MFHGLYVATVTPFLNGKLDESGYRKLLQYILDGGADGIVPNGTTGENPVLDDGERKSIIKITVEMCREKGSKVIAGAGTNNTVHTIKLVNEAEKWGADAGLVITPYYNKPTQDGLIRHFKMVAQNTNLPLMMYNVPSRTGVNMTADTAIELSFVEHIIGTKEASGNLVQIAEITRRAKPGFVVLSGEDGLALPMLAVGAKGVISVAGNVTPLLMKQMLSSWERKNLEQALSVHWKLLPLFEALFLETNPAPCKKALEMMGICSDEVRPPLAPVKETTVKSLKKALSDLKILKP